MDKFGRNYIFEIEGEDGIIHQMTNPLTMDFRIVRNNLASANTGNFILYNLNKDTRNSIYKDSFRPDIFRSISLRAGYGDHLPLVFSGNVKECLSYRPSGQTNFMTVIEAYDMGFGISKSISNWSLIPTDDEPEITKNKVIDKLVGDLQGYRVQKGVVGDFPGYYPRGRTVLGNTWETLQTETEKNCYIDNGKVYCLNNNDVFEGDITLIDSSTGLLGTPRKADRFLVIETLFEPRLSIGQQIDLQSRTLPDKFNGTYKVIGIDHFGTISDAVGGQCKTQIRVFLPVEFNLLEPDNVEQ